ncbi:MAG: DNA internalization-related competence protein ComEC/Rec2 [Hydrogenophaga sp.]|nr:DNA internalization-related competence protein ComEC/Rec2 [Hydrogenophaga sp.]MBX3609958.1 DNA internalization-related competence protein ComEC/Rec2 [Hydrogenophaga sp.]
MLGWVAGVAWQLQQPEVWPLAVYASLVAVGLLGLCLRVRLAWLLAGLALAVGTCGWRAQHRLADRLDPQLEGVDIAVVGRIASLPSRSPLGEVFQFAVERASQDGAPRALPARLQLSWYRQERAADDARGDGAPTTNGGSVQAGETWAFTVRLKRPHGSLNPHGFDREAWLWQHGIGATGYVRAGVRDPVPERVSGAPWWTVDRWRQRIVQRIDHELGERPAAGVLAALAVGDQSAIDRPDWDLFRATGVAHLMAISGLHITGFAWLATALVGVLWRQVARRWPALARHWPRSRATAWGGVGLAAAYAVLAGWGVPAQRTVLMLALVVGLRLGLRRWPWPALWLTVMAVVLALDPWAWLSAGFWLSFVAVAILFAGDPGQAAGEGRYSAFRRWLAPLMGLLREQWLMTLALAPLSLVLFGQVSVVGLVANLVAIPWVTLVVTPLAIGGVVVPWVWHWAAGAVDALGAGLQWLASWPWAVWTRPVAPMPLALAAVVGGALLALRLPPLWRAAGALLLVPALVQTPWRPDPGQVEVMALDVGQGSAVLVRTAHHALVFDAGPRWNPEADAGDRIVLPLLRSLGVRPDLIMISHRDSDHAGGAQALRDAFPEAQWRSSYDDDAEHHCLAGQQWTWDGVRFDVLHPSPSDYARPGMSTNAMSCVLRVTAGEHSAWLTGDIPAAQEVPLALARPDWRATLLLAPHHGSASSSSPVLLNTLRPQQVIVQSGYRNRFGHPAEVVVARYEARGINWVATPQCGAATWRSDQPDRVRCEREVGRRYWHWRD